MRTLFIDLASHQGLLACIDGEKVRASTPVDHRISDAELMPLLNEVLQAASWSMKDIQRIACVAGPGGFTSLRVAAAFTNALSYALDIPVAGIHLSDLYAVRVSLTPSLPLSHGERGKGGEGFLWLHSTKKQELFVRGFGSYAEKFPEATHISLADFLRDLSPLPACPERSRRVGEGTGVRVVGELIPDHEAEVSKKGGKRAELQPVESVLPTFVDSLVYEKKTLEPWYGRKW
ncbi:MAG: tRNA (adenosine(37)-N6)-threonylcarbamoyltransferase complex dimerization subunit type 1 TsaB [Candidatus Peribacteraceae bacterium]|nr:tRNA (adenosine(37)-N6)-threonylcarbamoyltransferase complex dimerization subunit type 1 TsaB [Candidatus Peribacteraceae bacterium]